VNSTDESIPLSEKSMSNPKHAALQATLTKAVAKGVLTVFPLGGNHCCEAQKRAVMQLPEDKSITRVQALIMLPLEIDVADQVCDL
jgi:hypothetical protein